MRDILAEYDGTRISVRHLFYRAVGAGVVEKTEKDYHQLVDFLTGWRKAGVIPYGAFADSLRVRHGRETFLSLGNALEDFVSEYRLNLWIGHPDYLEVWCEKDAVAGMLASFADPYNVKVFPIRGFCSRTALWETAQSFRAHTAAGRASHVYYFGDLDPSGSVIERSAVRILREMGADFTFTRVAVTREQVETYHLPTRPSKESTHSAGFDGDSVEVDALPVDILGLLVRECIERHIRPEQWEANRSREAVDRERIAKIAAGMEREP